VELYPTFSVFLELQFAVGCGLVNTVVLHCIWVRMGDFFSTVSKQIKQQGVKEFLMYESETPIRIHRRLLDLYGEDTVTTYPGSCDKIKG
jgi:hypothetical protein